MSQSMSFKAAATLRPSMLNTEVPKSSTFVGRRLSRTNSADSPGPSPGSAKSPVVGSPLLKKIVRPAPLPFGSPTFSVASTMSSESHETSSVQSKQSLLSMPARFLRKSTLKLRAWSKGSEPSSPWSPDAYAENLSVLSNDDDNLAACDFPGITVAHLQSLSLDADMTVTEAISKLNKHLEDGDAYVLSLSAKDAGPAHAVVLMCHEMQWSEFVAALARNGGPSRRVWIHELCEWTQAANWKEEAIAAIGCADLVFPSWANPAAFWTPEHVALTRMPEVKYRVMLSPADAAGLGKALCKGLPMSYFDDLVATNCNVGSRAINAIKSMIAGLISSNADIMQSGNEQASAQLMGHLALALKNYDGAIGYYKAQSDFSMLAEAYRRAGNLQSARSCLKLAVEGASDAESRLLCSLKRCRVILDMGLIDQAIKTALKAKTMFERSTQTDKVAECCMFLADAYTMAKDEDTAIAYLNEALSTLNENNGSSATIASVLHKLGMLQRSAVGLMQSDDSLALRTLTEALFVFRRVLGELHLTTLECKADKARLLLAMGNVCEASDLLRSVNEQFQRLFGSASPKAMALLEVLIEALEKSGSRLEAAEKLEELLASCVLVHGRSSDVVMKVAKRIINMRILCSRKQ